MLNNAVFCFTGKAPKPRKEMEAIAIKAGGSVTKSITKQTTILVIADKLSNSLKARKARQGDLLLISPKQFFKMCNDPINPNKITVAKGSFHTIGDAIEYTKSQQQHTKSKTQSLKKKKKHSSTRRIEL